MNALETKIAIIYALAFVPILFFVIRSKRSPVVFLLGSAVVFASSFLVRAGVESIAGYPTTGAVPEHMALVGFHSTPPGADAESPQGSIYLFGTATPAARPGSWLRYVPAIDEPRAYVLTYSEDLDEALRDMDAAKQKDRLVEFEIVDAAQTDPGRTTSPATPEAQANALMQQAGKEGLSDMLDEARGLAFVAQRSTDRGAENRPDPDYLADALSTMSAQLSGAAKALPLVETQEALSRISEDLSTLGRELTRYHENAEEYLQGRVADARSTAGEAQRLLDDFRTDLQARKYGVSDAQLAQLNEVGKAGYQAVQKGNKALRIGAIAYQQESAREAAVSAKQFAIAADMTDDSALKEMLGAVAEALDLLSEDLGYATEPAELARRRGHVTEEADMIIERIDGLGERIAQDPVAEMARLNASQEKILPLDEGRMIRLSAIPRQELTGYAK